MKADSKRWFKVMKKLEEAEKLTTEFDDEKEGLAVGRMIRAVVVEVDQLLSCKYNT
jgi:hypothetical protein